METKLLALLSAMLLAVPSTAQIFCGFDEVHRQKLQADPYFRQAVHENEKRIQHYISKNKRSITARTTGERPALYTIPVVVHIVHTGGSEGSIYNPSDLQIQSAISYLNKVYNGSYPGIEGIGDIQIQFALAVRDPYCNPTTGIVRVNASSIADYSTNGVSTTYGTTPGVYELSIKNLSRWDPSQYYNIWVVNKINGKDGSAGSFLAGLAYYPGATAPYDGTTILATQMASGMKTLPHEIGHAFGLYHTFEGSADHNSCPVNTDCSVDGDKVCDTDPIAVNQFGGVTDFTCRTGINPCTGNNYSSNTEHNYMSYTNCYKLFTPGQKGRMLANAEGPYRKSLSSSMALSPSNMVAAYGRPVMALCAPTTGSNGLTANYAGILSIDINNKSFGSSTAKNDNGYFDGTNSCLNFAQLISGSNNTFRATVLGANVEQLRAWIDYNNDGNFDNATEEILFTSSIAKGDGVAIANFTVPAWAKRYTMLRMRVIDELATLYGTSAIGDACFNSMYGQAEDYSVYIASGALPVTLVSFEGAVKNNVVHLSWKTASEEGVKDFEVEKSTDGNNFVLIGTVAAENEKALHTYHFTDGQPAENNYYRLRMNDLSGSDKWSPVVTIRYTGLPQRVTVVNNPFGNHLELSFTKPATSIRLQLINTNGTLVAEKAVNAVQGRYQWNLPANLARGTYVVKALADDDVFVMKVVKQ
ncbi:T9SS type A sorting domain-containing protein [Flavisolibacter sp. BT320]|nr:T9SS type A sorting domain-containing protein [Flavisolibacter longurius]